MPLPEHQLAAEWTSRLPKIANMLKQGGSFETAALQELSNMMAAVSDHRAFNPNSNTFEPLMKSIWRLLT